MCKFIVWRRLCHCKLGAQCVQVNHASWFAYNGNWYHQMSHPQHERRETEACDKWKRKHGVNALASQDCRSYWGIEYKVEMGGLCGPCLQICTKRTFGGRRGA